MKLSAPIHRLKHRAKRIVRHEGAPLHAALDRVAADEGYSSWSLLASRSSEIDAALVSMKLLPGNLLLVAARPGEGKTLFALELAVQAMEVGRPSTLFSLEELPKMTIARLRKLGRSPQAFKALFRFDDSDEICADYIVRELADASHGSLVVIDYLQLLDQRRTNAPLADQVQQLRVFAGLRGLIFVFISQIDRTYDCDAKPLPTFDDIRLPNPLDLALFDWGCFLQGGKMSLQAFSSPRA